MTLIDEDGRLFGRINVVDAAVVLLAIVVVGAGAFALYSPTDDDGGGESATRYATVDLGQQSPAVAERIADGDAAGGVTITDTYVGPAADGNASVVVRVRVDGQLHGDSTFEYAGDELTRGDDFDISTAAYDVSGEVLRVDEAGTTLDTGTLPILVSTSLPAATRDAVDAGDTYRIGGRSVATVAETVIPPVGNGTARTDFVGLRVRTINRSGTTYFGSTPVRLGEAVDFRTSRYAFSGTVERWGSSSPPGERGTTVATVVVRNVDPAVADGIEVGMRERRGETTTATITDVERAPTSVVLTSESGNIYEREHPRNQTVTLAVELRTRTTDDSVLFHGRPLREGATVTLDFGTIRVRGTVTALSV
ncbi:DUF4330 family protein [Haloplanus sp. C73]|uniref:DUF4330 family protein n=1 Tax=Haloplanus sp. C73 TaxID=3421641 RepID=UPI003EB88EE1